MMRRFALGAFVCVFGAALGGACGSSTDAGASGSVGTLDIVYCDVPPPS